MNTTLRAPISREIFEKILKDALAGKNPGEHWIFSLISEGTQFVRFNRAQVRQGGVVQDCDLTIKLVLESADGMRSCEGSLTLEGDLAQMSAQIQTELNRLRTESVQLPLDPFATAPKSKESSQSVRRAELLSPEFAASTLIEGMKGADVAGIYASGTMVRASGTSQGQLHWFETDSFSFDYSLYTPKQKALKSLLAGQDWDAEKYRKQMDHDISQLEALERAPQDVPRGAYRTYLAPQAMAEIIGMLAGTLSEGAIRQNKSPLRLMRAGEKSLSPLFSLTEDFSGGEVPRFNDEGELAPIRLPLIENGVLKNTLIDSRTAAEYKLTSNGAAEGEALRSPHVTPGTLRESEILERLGTGLYLSNLHYLNWSDVFKGRITGMTRYACFWVENGKIVAPIRDLRFDDSIFRILGSELEGLTDASSLIPETGSYYHRNLGATRVPGALIRDFAFTL